MEPIQEDSRTENKKSPRMLIHIGMQKTGSTALQDTLFIDRSAGFCSPLSRQEIMDHIIARDEFRFSSGELRELFLRRSEHIDPHENTVRVLSHECLVGNLHSGGRGARSILERLHSAFPTATVLLVIREQTALAVSAYKQCVRDGGTLSPESYFDTPRDWREIVPRFRFEHLEFDRIVKHLLDHFGRDQVLVLPYEWLRSAPSRFFSALARKLELPGLSYRISEEFRPTAPTLALPVLRAANLLFMKNSLNPSGLYHLPNRALKLHSIAAHWCSRVPKPWIDRKEDQLNELVAERVQERYGSSNARLQALTGLDLASLGYQVKHIKINEEAGTRG